MDAMTGATIVASVINSTSLNCRTNSSSSSSSSGYASGHSTASTPATPMSTHYDTATHTTLTSVSSTEHVPTATVAPVTPFYSETTLSQQQRQQYYQSYPYTNTTAQYNPVYDAYTGNSYHNLTTPSVERSLGSHNNHSQQRLEKQNKTLSSSHNASGGLSQHYGTPGATLTTTTCATTKPQATATPFFAQPSTNVNTTAATYYDAYGKYKMPSTTKLTSQTAPDYTTNYTNHLQQAAAAAATLSYQQQQQHYYAAKSQLQDVNYAAAVVKPHRQHNVGNSSAYYGSGGAYYDKYLYGPTANAAAYATGVPAHVTAPHPYSPHEPTTADPYRKAAAAVAANAWHWNMEYAAATAGNCRNLPPTANGSSYLSTPSASSTARDSFCPTTADKYSKYDKYGAYYASHHHPQQYMTPTAHSTVSGSTAGTRNLWPNSPHHTSHLATVPAVINERLSHTLPPSATQHQYPHTNTHHPFGTSASTTTQRQNCCTQPFQQQTCYYPRPTQQYPHVAAPNAYATTQPTHYGSASASSNSSHKYAAYGSGYKTSNNNDLYLTSPFDTPPAAYNYGTAPTTAMQQHYGGVSAASAAFYNDLNVQSAFESYAGNTISQSTMLQPHIASAHNVAPHHPSHHLSYQTHGTNQNIEYRKPLAATANDCCMSSTRVPLTNLEQHVANTSGYLKYDLHGNPVAQAHAVITSPTIYSDGGSSSEKSTPNTKNLSLRDFLTTWNEEEEEELNHSANEQLAFIGESVDNASYVTETVNESATMPLAATPQPNQLQAQHQQLHVTEQQYAAYKNAYQPRPKIHVGITVDGPMDVETSQFINLPDIIIDIEKSNNAGATSVAAASVAASTSAVEATVDPALQQHHSPCGTHDMFEHFDVEKELDELQIKRAKLCLEKQLNNEIRILTPEPVEVLAQDITETVEIQQQYQNPTTVHHTECEKSYDNADQFLKDIELNDNNSHSSNSSTFEKEYETFINRIDLDKVCVEREQNMRKEPVIVAHQSIFNINDEAESVSRQSSDIKTPPDPPTLSAETTMDESTQNLQDFTMFYKKKRKLVKDISEFEITQPLFKQFKPEEVVAVANDESPKITEVVAEPIKVEAACSEIPRKLGKSIKNLKVNVKIRQRTRSCFYKRLRRGHAKLNTSELVKKRIALLKERHLPLIKRQSFKNYTTREHITYNPRSLMHLAVSLVNTNAFQVQLLDEKAQSLKMDNCIENVDKTSEDEQRLADANITVEDQQNVTTSGLANTELTEKAVLQNEADSPKLTKTSDNLKESLEEQSSNSNSNSNSNSINGSASLKEQDDFNGFEESQNTRISPLSVQYVEENSAQRVEDTKIEENDSNNVEYTQFEKSENSASPQVEVNSETVVIEEPNTDIAVSEERLINIENRNIGSETHRATEMESNDLTNQNWSRTNDEFEQHIENSNIEKTNDVKAVELNECVETAETHKEVFDLTNADSNEAFTEVRNSEIVSNNAVDEFRNAEDIENCNEVQATDAASPSIAAKEATNSCSQDITSFDNSKGESVERNQAQQTAELAVNNSTIASSMQHCNKALSQTQHCDTASYQTQPLPAMRTKASVKMCDFSNIPCIKSSTKHRSKSVSPTTEKSSKTTFDFGKRHSTSAFPFDGVEKIDKAKFVEKWAASVGGINDNATEFSLLSQEKIEDANVEALDLSPSSRRIEQQPPTTATILIDDDSNSSTASSSSSSSTDSRSDNKSTSSAATSSSSSSSSASTTSSTTATSNSNSTAKSAASTISNNHNSTDASEFNELKALERELSQHQTSRDWEQTVAVKIANDAIVGEEFNIFNNKKTDELQNVDSIKVEAQDIADLKKILESEHIETAVVNVVVEHETTTDNEMEVCVDATFKEPASLKNITEAFIINQSLKLKDNDNMKKFKENIENENENENQQHHQQQQHVVEHVVIPKLSDLCNIALNSSFVMKHLNNNENQTNKVDLVMPDNDEPIPPNSANSPKSQATIVAEKTTTTEQPTPTPSIESPKYTDEQRELTVEEALAEMYRQVGVMSDAEDNADDGLICSDNGENQAQDYLLINLAEILENSDSENNVFVLQCDMNENLLRVMTTTTTTTTATTTQNSQNAIESVEVNGNGNDDDDDNDNDSNVSALQLVQLLNASDLEIIAASNNEENIDVDETETESALLPINEDSYSAFNDLPIIHHEEIVPDNYKKFEKEQFLKYLHAKYVQKNIKKFHQANRILKKYRRRFLAKKSSSSMEAAQQRSRL